MPRFSPFLPLNIIVVLLLAAMIGSGVFWLQVEEVKVMPARVIATLPPQEIKAPLPGLIAPLVSMETLVKEGAPLLRLQRPDLEQEAKDLQDQILLIEAQQARLEAEMTGQELVLPTDLPEQFKQEQYELYQARQEEFTRRLSELQDRLAPLQEAEDKILSSIANVDKRLKDQPERPSVIVNIPGDPDSPEEWAATQSRRQAALVAERQSWVQQQAALIKSRQETERGIERLSADRAASLAAENRVIAKNLKEAATRLADIKIEQASLIVVAPADGIVRFSVAPNQEVAAGTVVATLSPEPDTVFFEAFVDPALTQITPGTRAHLRLQPRPTAAFATVTGTVERELDAAVPRFGEKPAKHFIIRSVEKEIRARDQNYPLLDGMTAEATFYLGSTSVWNKLKQFL
ncbi:MAG: HlyD family efflux transporter periplasmic adaptor subunit [Dongiaceae bacterium]